jgi:hypothetical protein
MRAVEIPPFVKSLGHRIIAYTLNADDANARAVLAGHADLNEGQNKVLQAYVQLCRRLRMQGVDQDDIGRQVAFMASLALQGYGHVFASWREQMGGQKTEINYRDHLTAAFSELALDVYPLSLIKASTARAFPLPSLLVYSVGYGSPIHDRVCQEILKDESLRRIFPHVGEDAARTRGHYVSSTGRGGDLQLATFPATVLAAAHELMMLRGHPSEEGFVSAVSQVIDIMRLVASDGVAQVPVYMGFHNVALETEHGIEITDGLIRPYSEELSEIVPADARPVTSGSRQLGLVLESQYPYQVSFDASFESKGWPPELDQGTQKLSRLDENLSLAFALSIDRMPPVGITRAWTLVVDPLAGGSNISWKQRRGSPVPHYCCTERDLGLVRDWYSLISQSDEEVLSNVVDEIFGGRILCPR